ncbi:MAG TPA: amidohydrolase family protein [Acidimicrobiales bacterium]|nr:amidohydrolase family protein [Acidimicrobiales bacterium]
MARTLDFPIFDADNHLYETKDAFTRHLPKQYREAIRYVEVEGRTKIVVRGTISDYIPNPTFEVVARPGAQEEYFRIGNPEGKSFREVIGEPMRAPAAFREPAPRLELMDELGVDRTLMFPTLASLLEERLRDDPVTTHVVIHALNEWLYETWQFNYEDRIFTTPVITLPIVEKAIEELEWAVERGAKTVLIRPAPVPGFGGSRSFAYPEFDPFWQAVVDHDILVSMHASDSGYARYQADWTGPQEMLPFRLDSFRMLTMGKRAAEDTAAAMTCHGLLTRFPDLRIAFIENGADWVIPFLEHLADVHRKVPQMFEEDPVEAFKRNVYISPFHEDHLDKIIETLGIDHVLFGSDYPHPEGLAEPCSYADHLPADMPHDDIAKIMGGNLANIMRVPVTV